MLHLEKGELRKAVREVRGVLLRNFVFEISVTLSKPLPFGMPREERLATDGGNFYQEISVHSKRQWRRNLTLGVGGDNTIHINLVINFKDLIAILWQQL